MALHLVKRERPNTLFSLRDRTAEREVLRFEVACWGITRRRPADEEQPTAEQAVRAGVVVDVYRHRVRRAVRSFECRWSLVDPEVSVQRRILGHRLG